MLLRNLSIAEGLLNGAGYQVVRMKNSRLILKSIMGIRVGKILALPKMPCGPGDEKFPIDGFERVQIPVRVCFGLTTNKSQGSSFGGALGLDMWEECFSHGQRYVSLSSTTHPGNVFVLTRSGNAKTKNVDYHEALR